MNDLACVKCGNKHGVTTEYPDGIHVVAGKIEINTIYIRCPICGGEQLTKHNGKWERGRDKMKRMEHKLTCKTCKKTFTVYQDKCVHKREFCDTCLKEGKAEKALMRVRPVRKKYKPLMIF